MAFDSSADLLFKIGADASDAENNVARFLSLMSKDLASLQGEIGSFVTKTFGDLSTFGGAFKAGLAGLAAGAVAVGGAMFEAAKKTAEYAHEVQQGMEKTGLTAREMSGLIQVAKGVNIGYEQLVGSLVKFESAVVAARDKTSEQAKAFHQLGISQEQIEAGQKNLWPLLMATSDRFHEMGSAVERTALARKEFGRGGAELNELLGKGSKAIQEQIDLYETLGLTLSEKDIEAAKQFRFEVKLLHAELDGLWNSLGKSVLPSLAQLVGMLGGASNAAKETAFWVAALKQDWAAMAYIAGRATVMFQKQAEAMAKMGEGGDKMLPPPEKTKEAAQEFDKLTKMVEQAKVELASTASESGKITAQFFKLHEEASRATVQLKKLHDESKIDENTFIRERTALEQLIPLIGRMTAARLEANTVQQTEEQLAATEDLERKLRSLQEQTFERRLQSLAAEQEAERRQLGARVPLTGWMMGLQAAAERAGRARIENERTQAFAQELVELQQHLAEMVMESMTSFDRLAFQYDQDVARYSEAQLAKAKRTTDPAHPEQGQALEQQFALNLEAALRRSLNQVNALRNSQGWRGVFGDLFAQGIRRNEALLREWAQSSNQSLMLVRVSMEILKEKGQDALVGLGQSMAANIAQAIVYKQSIGDAMRAALAATASSLAAEAYMYGLMAAAKGVYYLATQQYDKAAYAFAAAGLFGAAGTAASAVGRAVAPSQKGAGGAAGEGKGSTGGAAAGASTGAAEEEKRRPYIQINITGHVIGTSGIEELTGMINDAVQNRDVRLIATQTRSGRSVTQG